MECDMTLGQYLNDSKRLNRFDLQENGVWKGFKWENWDEPKTMDDMDIIL